MSKRYQEPIAVAPASAGARGAPPARFSWRGGSYRVVEVVGHWREDAAYWSGGGIEVPQRDLWRVEARGQACRGVFELVREGDSWRLDRVWD